jgi:kynureninase
MNFTTDLTFALEADAQDNLASFRERFFIADPDLIYLDGNSLGRLLRNTQETINHLTRYQWGEKLIGSWNGHWYDLPEKLGNQIAGLIGATEGEVILTDNTSVNLYKLAYGALKMRPGRTKVVSDQSNFPTDLYILQGILKDAGPGYELELCGSRDGIYPDLEELDRCVDENTALLVLSLVNFKSGYLYDLQKITGIAHQKGAFILWDLSHATGAVPVDLNHAQADLAVGCTYKYLNGGPGAPAFLYVRKDLQEKLINPVQGWFGDINPFDFRLQYKPSDNIRKFLTGTPPIISLAAIASGIEILTAAGIHKLREKSISQCEYLLFLFDQLLQPLGFKNGSPVNAADRGSHVAIRHPEAYRICQSLIHPKYGTLRVVPDFRDPDIIRIGITPLYTSYLDIRKAIHRIQEIALNREYLNHPEGRQAVT